MGQQPKQPQTIARDELVERVAYALLGGAARVAEAFQMPLKRLRQLLEMRVFHDLQRERLPVREIAARLSVSPRTAADLAKRLKTNFLAAERTHTLPRRIEFVVWSQPLGAARIRQALGDVSAEEVEDALERLVEAGRVARVDGRTPKYSVRGRESRMVADALLARIDGLDNLLRSVSNAVLCRFFRDDPRAQARTVSLRMRRTDLPKLQELYEQAVWEALKGLEERVEGASEDEVMAMDVSVVWAPRDPDGPTDEE